MIQGRVLAIDYGEVRVGIALSDPLRILATPFVVLKNDGNLLENIKKIITEKQVSQIVLGLPINLKGKDSKKTEEIREFYRKLKDYMSLPIELVDERFTTYEANAELKKMGYSVKESRKVIDKIAASLILKSYLKQI